MIKVKDGYGKLIGTEYKGSAIHVLLSDGGNLGYAIISEANSLVQRNASGQIESSLTTDSSVSPFKITSTVLNTNLNSDLLDGFHAVDLFQNLASDRTTNLTIKIGNTEKKIDKLYATYDGLGNTITAKYVTLDTNLDITGVKDFKTQQKFSVAQGTAPFTVVSTNVVTNLNADLLDGTHKGDLFTDFSNITSGTDINKVSITIGGTTKKIIINYAQNAGSIGGITADGLFTDLSSTPAKNLSITIGGTTKDITSLYSNYWVPQAIGSKDFNTMYGDTYRGTSWYGGGSNTATNNPLGSGSAFGMLVWRNADGYTALLIMSSNGKLYIRYYNGSTWSELKQFAFTTDAGLGGGYWANLAVLATADSGTKPTFAEATVTTQVTTPKVRSTGRLTLNATSTALDLKFANDDTKSVILNGTEFKPFDSANGNLDLGASDARWKGLYAGIGDFTGIVRTTGDGFYLASTSTYPRSRWIYTSDGIWLLAANWDGNSVKGTLWITGQNANNLTKLNIKSDNTDYNGTLSITSDGRIVAISESYRQAGMYGIYDSTKVGHIWSMGTSFAINANGSNTGNLYGLAYFHTNWSNASAKNDGSKTEVGPYAGNHQAAWVINGKVCASLGNYVWSRNGFIKHGSSDDYVLLGGGGHTAISTLTPSGYYWANVKVSATSSTTTTPTFGNTTINGVLAVNGGVKTVAITHNHTLTTAWNDFIACLNPKLTATYHTAHITFGRTYTSKNTGYIGFKYAGDASNSNMVTIGLHSVDNILNILASGNVGIGTTQPAEKLDVVGIIRSSANSRYLRLGPQNSSHAHYDTNADISHWFNKRVEVNGHVNPYSNNSFTSGTSDKRWSNVYSYLGNFAGTVSINCAWPNIVCNNNASGANESNIRFEVAGANKGYVGYNTTYGTWVYNSTAQKYLGVSDAGVPHISNHPLLYNYRMAVSSAFNANNMTTNAVLYTPTGDVGSNTSTWSNFPTGKPAGGFGLLNINEGHYERLIFGTYANPHLYTRYKYYSNGSVWSGWSTIALTSDIPNPANYYWANIRVSASSSTGTLPTFNTCYTSNWFRSTGATGWYNETYLGGIHMLDSTWVRTYNGKSFYCSAIILAGNRFYTGYDSGLANSISCSNWFRSNGTSGWYNPTYECHVYPNNIGSYGGLVLRGTKNSYHGALLGPNTNHMVLMSHDVHHGLYCEATGVWEFYYNRSSSGVGIRTSTITKNFNVSGQSYLSSNTWIGTTSGGEMLNVGGWVGTTGNAGWYSLSYAGGIYMEDSTWVRIYNNKKFYVSNSDYSAIHSAGGVYVAGAVHSYANYLKSTCSGKTITIGSANASYCHYLTDAPSHWFNKSVYVQGHVYGGSSYNRRLAYVDELPTNSWRGIENVLTSTSTSNSLTANMGRVLANGGSDRPIVLLAGTLYRNGASSSYTTWYFNGYRHRSISSSNPSVYVSGGVARFYFTNTSGYSFTFAQVCANHQASGEATSYQSTEYQTRSSGLFWFGTYAYGSYLYIRAIALGDSNNDTAESYTGMWTNYSDGVTRVSIIAVGYAS